MTRFFRTMRVKAFRGGAAFEYLRRLADYINSNYPEVRAQIYRNILGHEYATAYLFVDVEDYPAWEQFVAKASGDPKYLSMRKENEPDLIIDGSVVDAMMRSV
jgi:hypothetical protein